MAGKRASVLHHWMGVVEIYTLGRALTDLTQDEFDWEPHPGAWGVRRREEAITPDASGDSAGDWVIDQDWAITEAADAGTAVEPMTTIGWLLNHFGAAPLLTSELDFVGGPTTPTHEVYGRMWGHTVIPTVDEAVARFQDGWSALKASLRNATDEMLEADCEGHPWKRGDRAIGAMINEVSHHGTQICTLRDLYAHRAQLG